MAERLAANILIGALTRRVEQAGGFAMIIHRGDAVSGAILVQCLEKGEQTGLFERQADFRGGYRLMPCGPGADADHLTLAQYIERRRRADPDMWVIELDVADAQQLASELLC